jgi:PAS domain S-box-containing protein
MPDDLFTEIVLDLNAGRTFQEILESIYGRMRSTLPCNRIGISLYDAARDTLTAYAVKSDGEVLLAAGYSSTLKGSSLEPLLRSGTPRVIPDLEAHFREHPGSESTGLIVREGMLSSLSLPLIARGRPFGVLFISSRARNSFTDAHVAFTGRLAGHISVALERSLLIEEHRANKQYMESILENSADAIVIVDQADLIRSWNRAAERLFGWPAKEIIGESVEILIPEELREAGELKRIRAAVERAGYLQDFETVRVDRDGKRLAMSITSSAIRDAQGRIVGRSAILRDLTRMKKLQSDLVRSQSLASVGELAATVAHEIKNPLAGISGAIQVIADAIPVTDSRREIVAEILAQVRRLDETVRDLLVFARPWTPEMQSVDLVELVGRVTRLLSHADRIPAVLFRIETPPSASVTADPRLLQEVLFNVLQNALDASPGGGEVRVVVEERAGEAILRIIDSGTGITPAHMQRLFSPFFTTKTRGTGLGLAISKRMVEAHGGRIDIDSVPGKGTEVRITLPLVFELPATKCG